MKILDLILKHKWYDMIASGEKPEEYRDFVEYWVKRLCYTHVVGDCQRHILKHCDTSCMACAKTAGDDYCAYPFDVVRFHRGYTNTTMTFAIKSITIGIGNPRWGAPTDREVFIIKLGTQLNENNL